MMLWAIAILSAVAVTVLIIVTWSWQWIPAILFTAIIMACKWFQLRRAENKRV